MATRRDRPGQSSFLVVSKENNTLRSIHSRLKPLLPRDEASGGVGAKSTLLTTTRGITLPGRLRIQQRDTAESYSYSEGPIANPMERYANPPLLPCRGVVQNSHRRPIETDISLPNR